MFAHAHSVTLVTAGRQHDPVASGGMARTKLIVEITTKDDKTQTHECVDFPYFGGEFITLCKKDFIREQVRTETVLAMRSYFK